jgi:hypothetical protein
MDPANFRLHFPTSIAPSPMVIAYIPRRSPQDRGHLRVFHLLFMQACSSIINLGQAHPAEHATQRYASDMTLPHPYFDEFARPDFSKTPSETEGFESYHAVYGPQRQKKRANIGLSEAAAALRAKSARARL